MPLKETPYRTVLLFGPPGSGKGTQGKILGTVPGFFHLSCGEVFRNIDPESELGRVFMEYSSQGLLVPDSYTVRLWLEHIHRLVRAGQFSPQGEILLLDGIPRNAHQAEMMADYIDVGLVIHLEALDEEAMIHRLRRRALHDNRLDDANESTIRQRFRSYEDETAAVLNFYPPERIRRVDACRPPLAILRDIIQIFEDEPVAGAEAVAA